VAELRDHPGELRVQQSSILHPPYSSTSSRLGMLGCAPHRVVASPRPGPPSASPRPGPARGRAHPRARHRRRRPHRSRRPRHDRDRRHVLDLTVLDHERTVRAQRDDDRDAAGSDRVILAASFSDCGSLWPVSTASSLRFGTSTSTCSSTAAGRDAAGAGFRITVPAAVATAAATVSMATSSWTSSTLACREQRRRGSHVSSREPRVRAGAHRDGVLAACGRR
jgi:hypothetical protein